MSIQRCKSCLYTANTRSDRPTPSPQALILSIRGIVTPLAAGNTVLAKSSELVPGTQYLWGRLFAGAGLPRGCLNILHVGRADAPEATRALIEDFGIRHVSFVSRIAVDHSRYR